ncbi:GNAT family N-acetyltransferase [Pseudomonas sp.]|uniref:GNAT family N-acetyltransferase n=1 Tax=Pseudomonas sp. TaxID=306 RepID=UPI003D1212DB
MFSILKINDPSSLQSTTLLRRVLNAHGGRSQEFVALVNGQEAGILSYEDWCEKKFGFIYEIYVLPSFRRQGVGEALLEYGEKYALQLGCNLVQIEPYALDQEPSTTQLIDWYRRAGYQEVKEHARRWEKQIFIKMSSV